MTAPERFSAVAQAAADRYLEMIYAFRAAYDGAVARHDALTPRAAEVLTGELYRIGRVHVATETQIIERELAQTVSDALRDVTSALAVTDTDDIEKAVSDALSASHEHLRREVSAQVERDITTTIKRYRDLGLAVEIETRASGWQRSAVIARRRLAQPTLRHYFKDRSGRRWPSQRFIRSAWRHAMLDLYNEVVMHELATRGETEAIVWHPDRNARAFGQIVSLTGEGVAYEDIRDDVFHPNSDAILAAVQSSLIEV